MFDLDSALGVEIQGDSLVFASVAKGFQGYTLKSSAVLEHYRELPLTDLQHRIQSYAESNSLNRENVILGLPRDQVVIRQIDLPLEVEENLDQVVRLQVERFEPLEGERSCYDYIVVDRNESEKRIRLQIMMVHQSVLDAYLDLFRELNLYPAAVRVSSVGLHQVFSAHNDGFPKESACLVVQVDVGGVEFVLLAGSDRFFSRRVVVSEEDLSFDRLLDELDRFFALVDEGIEGITKIYVTGPSAERFVEEFRERFQVCERLSRGVSLRNSGSRMARITGAVGLAISGTNNALPSRFNLIPSEKRLIAERPSFIPTLVLAGLLAIVGLANVSREYFQQSQLIGQIESQIRALQPQVEEAMDLRRQVQEHQEQLEELQNLMTDRQKTLLVVQELTERIPQSSFLQNLTMQGDRVSMTGFSDSASALLKILLESQYLGTVESRYITPDRTRANREKFSFQATVREPQSEDLSQ